MSTEHEKEVATLRAACLSFVRRITELEDLLSMISSGDHRSKVGAQYDVSASRIEQDYYYFSSARADVVTASKPFTAQDSGHLRFISMKLEKAFQEKVLRVLPMSGGEACVIRQDSANAINLKAVAYTHGGGVKSLTLQNWNERSEHPARESITLSGEELDKFTRYLITLYLKEFGEKRSYTYPVEKVLNRISENEEWRRENREELKQRAIEDVLKITKLNYKKPKADEETKEAGDD